MSDAPAPSSPTATSEEAPRRSLLKSMLAVLLGMVAVVLPLVPGLAVFTDPLRRKKRKEGKAIRITTLDAVPADGLPQRFQVVDTRVDKWNVYPPQPIDGVYLVRADTDAVPKAFSATCPHLGCAVEFKASASEFQCPCHTSGFAIDGAVQYGPSPRGLDELKVEIRNGQEVWIVYQRFKVGKADKIAVS